MSPSWQLVLQSVVRCSWFCSADGTEGMGRDYCKIPKSLRLAAVHVHIWRLCSAQLLEFLHSFIWTCTNNFLHRSLTYHWSTAIYTQLTLICTSCICEFAYLLKFICHPKINTHGAFWVPHGHVQNSKTLKICLAFMLWFSDCKQVLFWWCIQYHIIHIFCAFCWFCCWKK